MKNLMLALCFLYTLAPSYAQERPQEIFLKANEMYTSGDYKNAALNYSLIIEMGLESAELYYNLGNAFYKDGDMASAILYYEKSLKLAPSNPDAKFNLKLANLRIADKIEPLPELPIKTWWRELVFSNSTDAWGWISITALFFAALLLAGFVAVKSPLLKRFFFYPGITAIIISVFCALLGYQQKTILKSNSYAIVFDPSLVVKSAPDESGTKLFVVHEGTKVRELDQTSGWTKISLANGNVGWVKSGALKGI